MREPHVNLVNGWETDLASSVVEELKYRIATGLKGQKKEAKRRYLAELARTKAAKKKQTSRITPIRIRPERSA